MHPFARTHRCPPKQPLDYSTVQVSDVQEVPHLPLQWQAATHLPERRMMVRRILQLSQSRRKDDVNPGRAVLLAKRIELALYSRAGSLLEYSNLATLRRRLQSLVASSVHEGVAREIVATAGEGSTRKRRVAPKGGPQGRCSSNKRQRGAAAAAGNSCTSYSLFPSVGEDCTRLIFTYLDGQEIMRHRQLNRFAAAFLPTCVHQVAVEVAHLAHGFRPCSSMLLMTNLQHLVVQKAGTLSLSPAPVGTLAKVSPVTLPLYAWGCAELPTTQSNDGERVVLALAHALSTGAFPALKQLEMVSVFINTMSCNGLGALCKALATGCCPLLEDLLLAGNSLADQGAYEVARLLQSHRAPRLIRLDLRRNFIGETGLRAVLAAMTHTQLRLQVLCLGGNLVTDNCVSELQKWLAGQACPVLRFLGLEDNFLSAEGAQVVLKTAAVNSSSATRPRRVSCDQEVTA
uniref:Uncharacterized protein n=1 Tax=Peronospora matthiolae TaxID=2874970 RepID=A0AAV1UNU5_9STRA